MELESKQVAAPERGRGDVNYVGETRHRRDKTSASASSKWQYLNQTASHHLRMNKKVIKVTVTNMTHFQRST